MPPEYLPKSRWTLPPGDRDVYRARRVRPHRPHRRLLAVASSPLLLALFLLVPLLLIFPKALGDGLKEGEAV